MRTSLPRGRRGFTLIELLVVVGIVVLLAALSLPAFRSASAGAQLTSASQAVIDGLNGARQIALTLNQEVEVRFYQFPDVNGGGNPPQEYQAFQAFSLKDGVYTALGKTIFLPKTIVISSDGTLSPPLSGTAQAPPTGAPSLPGPALAYTYLPLRFRADGAIDTSVGSWNVSGYLTLCRKSERTSASPVDFITIQIDALSGRVRGYRP